MNNLPKAVRAQGDAAEQLAIDHGLKQGQGNDQGKAEAAKVIPQAEPVKTSASEEDWETRFKNYKSKTDDTIREQREQLGVSQQNVTELQRQVQELIAKVQAVPEKSSNDVVTSQVNKGGFNIESLPAEMREKYDDEFLLSMSNLNSIQMADKIGKLQSQLDNLVGNVESVKNTQVKTASEKYYERLDAEWAGWDTDPVNGSGSSDFVQFINNTKVSEFDQRSLADLFYPAHDNLNADTVLKIRARYKLTQADVSKGKTSSDSSLEELSAPDNGNGSTDVANEIGAHTEVFTQSQVSQFYSDVTKNKYKPEEATAIEQKILAAQKAGKILPG